jgi:tryptophanase
MRNGGTVVEIIRKEGLEVNSELPFKGDLDIERLRREIETIGASWN